jgi:hypothetical protein
MASLSHRGCVKGVTRAFFILVKRLLWLALLAGLLAGAASAQSNVVTYHYDLSRSGLNPNEITLTPSNVNSTQFGKLFSYPVDGYVFAQPLYIQNLTIPGKGTHNVVFVATEKDTVYAFDADSNTGANAVPLWQASMIDTAHGAPSGALATTSGDVNCTDTRPFYGVTGTPTIDTVTGTMYLVAKSTENGNVVDRLHAIDISTGAEKTPGPTLISPTVSGTGDGSKNNLLTLNSTTHQNRAGLLLLNGNVYVAFGSICDLSPWHGWLMAYDATTLTQKAVFNSSPNAGMGGIWMAGGAFAVDSNSNLFFASGNGTYDGTTAFGDSVIRMAQPSNGSFPILDWFTPYDQIDMSTGNIDQGSGGVLLIPDQPAGSPRQHLLVTGGKDGTLYLLDRDNLGHFNSSGNSQVWQSLPNAIPGLWSTPAWWNNNVFLAGSGDVGLGSDYLRAYHFDPATDKLSGVSTSHSPTQFSFPAPSPVVSSNGNSNAIVWVLQTDQFDSSGAEILRAYDATNLANELYNSSQNSSRDNPGPSVKFTVPTVINGKVYVGTETQLSVFGEFGMPSAISVNPNPVTGGNPSTGTVFLTAPAPTGGSTLSLLSSNPAVASVPGSVLVPAGATSATFTVTTSVVVTTATPLISATGNNVTQSVTLTVNPVPSTGPISFIKSAGMSGESAKYTVAIAPAAGHFLGVFVWQVEGATAPSVTDNLGNTYTQDCDLTYDQGFGLRRLTVYHLLNSPGGITGVSITPNRASRGIVAEYSGMPTSGSVLDVCGTANTQTGTITSWSSAAATATSGALIFGLADSGFTASAGYKAGGAWTGRQEQGDATDIDDSYFEDQINATPGNYTATGTTSAAAGESSVVIAYKTSAATPPPLTSVMLNPSSLIGGSPSTGTATLGAPAPSGGAVVTLTSSNTSVATVPPSVTVAANATAATFTVTTSSVTVTTTATISAAYNSSSQSAILTVNPSPITSQVAFVSAAGNSAESVKYTVSFSPTAGHFLGVFVWQTEGAATPTLTDNLGNTYTRDCDLTMDQGFGARRLTVYHLLNAPAGITGIVVTPNRSSRTIVAEYSGMPTSGAVLDACGTPNNQTAAATSWSSTATTTSSQDLVLGLADTGLTGNAGYAPGGSWTGRLAQHDAPDGDDGFLEDQISVPAGIYTATGTTSVSATESTVLVSFKTSGAAPLPSVTSVTLSPSAVPGGSSSTGTVTLSVAAPVGGALVTLASSNPSVAAVPASGTVTVLSGATTATFPVTTSSVLTTSTSSISATYSSSTQSATLTVNPVGVAAFVRAAGNSGESALYTVNIAPAAGDFLVAFVWQTEGAATPTITDNLGSAYALDCNLTFDQGFGARRLTVYHLLSAAAGITGVRVTPNRSSRTIVAEYSGMASTAALDVCGAVNNQTTNVTSWSSTAASTTGAKDLIFGLADSAVTGNAGYAASGAWAGRLIQHDTLDGDDSFVEDQLNVAAGSYTATGTSTTAARQSSVVVGFKVQ